MNLMTKVTIPKSNHLIDYNTSIFSLGSCFAENIGTKFQYFKYQITTNPFGIIFNPASLEKIIQRSIQKTYFTESDIFNYNDLWHCFEIHSKLSNPNKQDFLKILNKIVDLTNKQITESTHIIITLGTSWVYKNKATKEIVANCHKLPQKQFTKELLSTESIKESVENIITLVKTINKNVTFIFTVSPVRHLKDGFIENTLSKSNLITALHSIFENEHYKPNTEYFPSYEIMIDELRDYRFYADDMLHPSHAAINYIWERFKETNISAENFIVMIAVENIQKALTHKPFNPNTESHLKFLEDINQKINILAQQYPRMNFDFNQDGLQQ
jgi:hypothetical protein